MRSLEYGNREKHRHIESSANKQGTRSERRGPKDGSAWRKERSNRNEIAPLNIAVVVAVVLYRYKRYNLACACKS